MDVSVFSQVVGAVSPTLASIISIFLFEGHPQKAPKKEPAGPRQRAHDFKKTDLEQSSNFIRKANATDIWNTEDLDFWLLLYGATLAASIFTFLSLASLYIGAIVSIMSYQADGLSMFSKMSATFDFSLTAATALMIQIFFAFALPMFVYSNRKKKIERYMVNRDKRLNA